MNSITCKSAVIEKARERTVLHRIGFVLMLVSAVVGGPVSAQTGANPTANQLSLAMQIMDVTNASGRMARMQALITPPMMEMIREANPNLDARTLAAFQSTFDRELQASMGGLLKQMAVIYARHFTEDDMRGMLAFYKTPVGKKLLKELPAITTESVTLGEVWGHEAGLRAAQRAVAQFKGKGLKI